MADDEYYADLSEARTIVGTGPWRLTRWPDGRVGVEIWDTETNLYQAFRIGAAWLTHESK